MRFVFAQPTFIFCMTRFARLHPGYKIEKDFSLRSKCLASNILTQSVRNGERVGSPYS